jgi:hypothetical protein
MGDGLLGWVANVSCIIWTCFIVVIFSLPNYKPVTPQNMNYAAVITGGVVIISGCVDSSSIILIKWILMITGRLWYMLGAHRHYKGPRSNLSDAH